MKIIKDEICRCQFITIEFDNQKEKKIEVKKLEKNDWEDLDPNSKELTVTLRKWLD